MEMSITATELKNNLGKYLFLSATEDIYITKNGKVVASLQIRIRIRLILRSLYSGFCQRMQILIRQNRKGWGWSSESID